MDSKKDINLFNSLKIKFFEAFNNDNEVKQSNIRNKFYESLSRKEVYKVLINKYANKKEISSILFTEYMQGKKIKLHINEMKDQGDLEDNINELYDELYKEEEETFSYPDIWDFRTNKSIVFKNFMNDVDFLIHMGLLDMKSKEVNKCTSDKKEFQGSLGLYKYESSGTKTKNAIRINLYDSELDNFF